MGGYHVFTLNSTMELVSSCRLAYRLQQTAVYSKHPNPSLFPELSDGGCNSALSASLQHHLVYNGMLSTLQLY